MSETPPPPEVWQQGPVPGFLAELQPVAHALLQVIVKFERHAATLTHEQLWARPFTIASVGFHLLHTAGSTDRLLTYARGDALSAAQLAFLRAEAVPLAPDVTAARLVADTRQALERALEQVRSTEVSTLQEPRAVGRLRVASTVWGLLFHAAEHASRHAGQLATTVKIVRGL